MVVDQLDFVRISILPPKTDTELIVYADAMLTASIAMQGLQTIPWRRPQILETQCRVDEQKLAMSLALELNGERATPLTSKDPFRILISERPDHESHY